jgi:hypothetical protein
VHTPVNLNLLEFQEFGLLVTRTSVTIYCRIRIHIFRPSTPFGYRLVLITRNTETRLCLPTTFRRYRWRRRLLRDDCDRSTNSVYSCLAEPQRQTKHRRDTGHGKDGNPKLSLDPYVDHAQGELMRKAELRQNKLRPRQQVIAHLG